MSGYITMREYDPASEELLTSFKEWADSNFGSVRHCFKALDSDRSGSVTFPELKRACHKMKWLGNVRTLFDCLDIDSGDRRNRDAATGKRAISLEELAFLDSWNIEPRPEVAQMEDDLAESEAKRVLSTDKNFQLIKHSDEAKAKAEDGKGGSDLCKSKSGPLPSPGQRPKTHEELPVMKRRFTTERPKSQGSLRRAPGTDPAAKLHDCNAKRNKQRAEMRDRRPHTDNAWLRSYTSFEAVEARR